MNYEIKKGVPLPPKCETRTGDLLPLIKRMEVGDCIERVRHSTTAINAAKKAGIKIATRKQADGTVTVWRVA